MTISNAVREVLEARQQLARTSLAKFEALERAITSGDKMRGAFLFHGADTGRWAGRIFQPQNLPRPIIKQEEIETARQLVMDGADAETWSMLYSDPMGALASLVRGSIAGKMTVVDLAAIEVVFAAWVAGSDKLLKRFWDGQDPYKNFAAKLYQTPYEDITKKQRTFCKPCVLGRQYGMGAKGLVAYAKDMFIDLPLHVAQEQIKVWNKGHGDIRKAWEDIQTAALSAIRAPGKVFHACRCKFKKDKDFLMVFLPSGRRIHYRDAEETQGNYGPEVAYLDKIKGRLRTYGAKLFENIVQAVSRDILAEGMLNAEAAGLEIFGHVHDEIMALGDCLLELITAMTSPPKWCLDAPIRAEGYGANFYRKD